MAFGRPAVKANSVNAQYVGEVAEPPWFDLLQDGYFFAFCISAVALPKRA